jgi:hypothetical protein
MKKLLQENKMKMPTLPPNYLHPFGDYRVLRRDKKKQRVNNAV